MSRLLVFFALLMGCSSDPSSAPTVDAGGDAKVACGIPGEAVECLCLEGRPGLGRCLSNGTIDPCVCLPLPADDAAVDARETGSIDTGPALDAAEAGEDARETIERSLCEAAGPRLVWKGANGCYDNGTADLTEPFYCRFRGARDGKVRCLPSGSTTIGGYAAGDCASQALTGWTIDPVPPYLMVEDTPAKVIGGSKLGSGAWYIKSSSSCAVQTTVYPFFTSKDETVYVTAKLADSLFVAAPF